MRMKEIDRKWQRYIGKKRESNSEQGLSGMEIERTRVKARRTHLQYLLTELVCSVGEGLGWRDVFS